MTTIEQALSLINSAAHYAKDPLKETLFSLKTRIMQQAVRRGAPVRYLYGDGMPSVFPWHVHPSIVEADGGPYHYDLIEVTLGRRAFHVPVSFASQHGLLWDLQSRPVSVAKRKHIQTGSKAMLCMPSKEKLSQAVRFAIEWML